MSKASLAIKEGVKVTGGHFDPEMVIILDTARNTAPAMYDNTVWVTSANDSKHMAKSLHYEDRAFDIRIRNIMGDISNNARLWVKAMKIILGDDYDVILEKDHIHAEYQPKPGGTMET